MSNADVAKMTITEVRRELATTRAEKARLAARELALVARMEALLDDPHTPAYVVPEIELMTHAGMTSREARDAVSRSHVADAAPVVAAVLADGRTTAAHVDAIGRGLQQSGPDREAFLACIPDLARAATNLPVGKFAALVRDTVAAVRTDDGISEFERQRRNTYLRTWTDGEGMVQLRGRLDPVSGAALVNSIERRKEQMFHSGDDVVTEVAPGIEPNDHRAALALIDLVSASNSSISTISTNSTNSTNAVIGAPRAEVVVHVDLESLRHGVHRNTTARTNLGAEVPVETIRRLACEADVIPVVLDGRSVPIDVGRAKRLATVHQRRALEAIHRTCAAPDCDVPFHHCQIHHIRYWENGGATDMDNQVPLCTRHHHAAHEGGWTLSLDAATRHVTFEPPHHPFRALAGESSDYRCRRDQRSRPGLAS